LATGRIGTTPVLTTRWSKAPAAGTTSLSGLDDNSVSLVYSVGYEQVYLNGALLSRTNDYTATNGTSITLTNATVAGDIVEVFANATIALTDTYTQSQANGKFINNTLTTTTGDIIYASAANTPARLGIGSTDQVLKVSGGIPAWGAAPAPTAQGVSVYNNVAQSCNSGVYTTLTFNSEYYDTDGFHSTSSNTSRLTVPTGLGGKYVVVGKFYYNPGVNDIPTQKFQVNGNDSRRATPYINGSSMGSVLNVAILNLSAGDYVEALFYHTAGSAKNVDTDQYGEFSMIRIGA